MSAINFYGYHKIKKCIDKMLKEAVSFKHARLLSLAYDLRSLILDQLTLITEATLLTLFLEVKKNLQPRLHTCLKELHQIEKHLPVEVFLLKVIPSFQAY